MRALLATALLLTALGCAKMEADAPTPEDRKGEPVKTEEKKPEPKVEPKKGEKVEKTFPGSTLVYNEQVTVKVWDAQGKKFLNPTKGVWAVRQENKGPDGKTVLVFRVHGLTTTDKPKPQSVITDADGNEYECLDGGGVGIPFRVKPLPKKP